MRKGVFTLAEEQYLETINADPQLIADEVDAVGEMETKLQEATDHLGNSTEVVERMEMVASQIEGIEGRDLSTAEETLLAVAMEEFFETLQISSIPTVSLEESFLDKAKERAAKIREQITTILRAILSAIQRMIEMAMEHFRGMNIVAARLYKQALAMYKEVDSMIGEPESKTYSNPAAAKRLFTPRGRSINAAMSDMITMCADAATVSGNYQYTKLLSAYAAFGGGMDPKDAMAELPGSIVSSYERIFKKDVPMDTRIKNAYAGVLVKQTDILLGGWFGVMVMPESVEALPRTQFKFERLENFHGGEEVRVASRVEAQQLLEYCMQITSLVRRYEQREQPRLNEIRRSVESAARRAMSGDRKLSSEDMAFIKSVGSVTPLLARGIHQQCFSLGIQSVRAVILHCRTSMEAYGSKK